MNGNFKRALKFVLDHENAYADGHYGDLNYVITENVAGDAGGLTKFGIDQAAHPHVDIKNLDYAGAADIYENDEWAKCMCDDLPDKIDIAVFDTAVNNGKGSAVILLQRSINDVLTKLPTPVAPIVVDGYIGPKTVRAATSLSNAGKLSDLVAAFLARRAQRYKDIVADHPSQSKFIHGWLDRVADLNRLLGALAMIFYCFFGLSGCVIGRLDSDNLRVIPITEVHRMDDKGFPLNLFQPDQRAYRR